MMQLTRASASVKHKGGSTSASISHQVPLSSFWTQGGRVENVRNVVLWYDAVDTNVTRRSDLSPQEAPHHVLNSYVHPNLQAAWKFRQLPSSTTPFVQFLLVDVPPAEPSPQRNSQHHNKDTQRTPPQRLLTLHPSRLAHAIYIDIYLQPSSKSWTESTSNTWSRKQLPLQPELSHVRLPFPSTAWLVSTSCQQSCRAFCQRSLPFYHSDPMPWEVKTKEEWISTVLTTYEHEMMMVMCGNRILMSWWGEDQIQQLCSKMGNRQVSLVLL